MAIDLDAILARCDAGSPPRLREIEQWTREDEINYPSSEEWTKSLAALKAGGDALEAVPVLVAELRAAREVVRFSRAFRCAHDNCDHLLCTALAAYDQVVGEVPR